MQCFWVFWSAQRKPGARNQGGKCEFHLATASTWVGETYKRYYTRIRWCRRRTLRRRLVSHLYIIVFILICCRVCVCCTQTERRKVGGRLGGLCALSLVRIIPRLTQSSFDLSSMSCSCWLGIDVAVALLLGDKEVAVKMEVRAVTIWWMRCFRFNANVYCWAYERQVIFYCSVNWIVYSMCRPSIFSWKFKVVSSQFAWLVSADSIRNARVICVGGNLLLRPRQCGTTRYGRLFGVCMCEMYPSCSPYRKCALSVHVGIDLG